jgi:hypothetical protein
MLDVLNFFRKKESDPLSGGRALKRLIKSLSQRDDYEAHQMLVSALKQFAESGEEPTLDRLRVLMRLDESSQGIREALRHEYLDNRQGLKHGEAAAWKELSSLYWYLARGYQAFVRHTVASRGLDDFAAYLPLITARALHHYGTFIKWRYFRQEPVDAKMWTRLHKLYRVAEAARCTNTRARLDERGSLGTCTQQYVRILLLNLLDPTRLRPAQIEAAELWLASWANLVTLDRELDAARHSHCIDFAQGAGPARLAGLAGGAGKMRYLGMQALLAEVNDVREKLQAGEVPEGFQVPAEWRLPRCIDLLDQIASLWSRGAASRMLPREREKKRVEVACGIEAIRMCLRPGDSARVSIEPIRQGEMEDQGDGGFGLKFEGSNAACVGIGSLVGLKTLGEDDPWEIGAMRWVTHTPGCVAVGIEKLSRAARLVELGEVRNDPAPALQGSENALTEAIFLPMVGERGMASSLIMPGEEYATVRQLELHDGSVVYRVRLTNVLESSGDWVRVRFDVLGRRQAARGASVNLSAAVR